MNKRQRKKNETKHEMGFYDPYNPYRTLSYSEIRMLNREWHEENVKINQTAKMVVLEQKQHTNMVEDILIAAYIPPKYRWRTIKLLKRKE